MLLWFREKQPQELGSHSGKQDIKNRLFRTHCGRLNLTALSRQVFANGWHNAPWLSLYGMGEEFEIKSEN